MGKTILVRQLSWPDGKPAYAAEARDEQDQVIVAVDPETWSDSADEALDRLLAEHPELRDATVINPTVPPYDSVLRHE